jgi:hypothetical protein
MRTIARTGLPTNRLPVDRHAQERRRWLAEERRTERTAISRRRRHHLLAGGRKEYNDGTKQRHTQHTYRLSVPQWDTRPISRANVGRCEQGVETTINPNEGLKPALSPSMMRQSGVETTINPNEGLKHDDDGNKIFERNVETTINPNEGLKPAQCGRSSCWPCRRNDDQPKRGIETDKSLICWSIARPSKRRSTQTRD